MNAPGPQPGLPLGAVKLRHSPLVPQGKACCGLQGRPVWYGSLHDLYDGSEFDELLLHADDLAELERRIGEAGPA